MLFKTHKKLPLGGMGGSRLNLRLPRGWNDCTTQELETIAAVMADCAQRTNIYHPYDIYEVKVALFFALANITILEPLNPRVKVEEQYYVCSHPDCPTPFNLYLWQIQYWVYGEDDPNEIARYQRELESAKRNAKSPVSSGVSAGDSEVTPPKKKKAGLLDWLDNPKQGLLMFPYSEIYRSKWQWLNNITSTRAFSFLKSLPWEVRWGSPSIYMDGFSWQQYRFAQDYMSYYIDQSNALLKLQARRKVVPEKEIKEQEQRTDLARAMFLATIFNRKVQTIDVHTGKTIHDYAYTSNQHIDNAPYFRNFPETQWQVILFWWTGTMHFLQKQYPHCFKKGKVSNTPSNPLELYTRTTATMEKYLGLDEDKVNRQLFHLVFQHMEDMAKENEEMEKIRRKSKH